MKTRMLVRTTVAGMLLALGAFAADAGRVQRDGAPASTTTTTTTTSGATTLPPLPDDRSVTDGPSFMAVDRTGTTWAVWSYRRGLELDIAVSRQVGSVWTTPELVGTANVDDLDPRIAFLPDNTPVLVWWQRDLAGGGDHVVWSALKAGAGWTAVAALDQFGGSEPNVFMTGEDITVVWLDANGTLQSRVIRFRLPSNAGGTGNNGPDPVPTGKS